MAVAPAIQRERERPQDRSELTTERETRTVRVGAGPITFAEYLAQSDDKDRVELVNGVLVECMVAFHEHESLFGWLLFVLFGYVSQNDLGEVLGSRTAVKITEFGGRLPDLLFVRQERRSIVREDAIYGPPDLVVEIISPNDRPSEQNELEAEYRSLQIPEIVFINERRRRVRQVNLRGDAYEVREIRAGALTFDTLPGVSLPLEWLFDTPRPKGLHVLNQLLREASE